MSKSIIIITTSNGNKNQYFRSENSSPMYLGKMLESFAVSAGFMGDITTGDHFCYLLGMEKGSVPERVGTLHGGVDYCWYVELTENGFTISYSEVDVKDFDGIQKYLTYSEGETIYIK